MNSFSPGTKVTICSDAAGKRPRRIGTIKRIGNGAWRLQGTAEWYDFEGRRMGYPIPMTFARLYQDGDEARIVTEDKRLAQRETLVQARLDAERQISKTNRLRREYLREASSALDFAKRAMERTTIEYERASNLLASAEARQMRANATSVKTDDEIKALETAAEAAMLRLKAFDEEVPS